MEVKKTKNRDKTKAELLKELEILREEQGKGVLKNFTECKQTVESLNESEEKYENLIESANESVISIDSQGNFLTLNRRAASYLGGLAENYIGKTLWDVFPPKVAEERFAEIQEVIQSKKPLTKESYLPFKGKTVCFLNSIQPIKNRSGDIYAVLILASDITEQKKAEEKLKDSEERLKILFDYAPDAYYISDSKGNFIDSNKAAERLTGYKREELIGKNFLKLKLLSLTDAPEVAKVLSKDLKGLPTGPYEFELNRKDNSKVIVEILAYPVKIKGETLGLGMARDVTERKKAEKALRESEEKYRTVFENTGTATIIIEEDTVISLANSGFEKLSGYSKEEIENKMKWTDFVISEDLERMKKYHMARRKAGDKVPTEYEFRFRDKKGIIKNIFLRVGMVPGSTKKSVASLMDITDRKQAEENMKNITDELETILNSVPAIIFYKDREGRIIRANKALADSLQVPIKDIVGKNAEEIFPGEETKNMREVDQEIITSGKPKRDIIRLTTPEGVRWLMIDRIPYKDKKGKITGVIDLAKDITAERESEEELKQSYQKLKKTMNATIETLSKIIEVKDPYTSGHQQRVCQLTVPLARELGLPEDQIEGIRISSLIHDIGKIGLPTETLSKPTKLTDIEFSLIKEHSQIGYNILKFIDFSYPIANIVLQHHEKLNGSGYPNHLRGNKIMLEARILGVADVVEAMSSHRPYRPALDIEKALEEITQNRGILYDPEVVDACLKLFREKGFKFK